MKKTLIISFEYPPTIGGIATYVDQLAGSLPPEKVVVLAPANKDEQTAIIDNERPFTIYRRKMLFPFFIWPRWMRLFFQVRKIVKKEQIQAIHLHHVLPVGYVAWLMKKFSGIPYLIFSHGTDIAAAGRTSWKRRMLRMVAKNAEQIIVNSENLKGRLLAVFPEFQSMTTVLYPCPNKEFFSPPNQQEIEQLKEQYALEGKKVLLTVARFDEGKGFPHLIRIMPDILRQDPYVVWLIIGDGTKEKREEIIEEIRKHNLQNIVRFIGKVPHDQLKKYYHLADIFVLLTHPDTQGREEGLGLVFLEAATAGLPIVAGRSGGVEDAVIHGQTGIVVDVQERPEDIRDAIVRLVQDGDYASQLGQAGQARIREEFQWEHQIQAIEKFL